MNKLLRFALCAAALLSLSVPASAIMVARACNDLACTGGDDIIVQDNSAGDTSTGAGHIFLLETFAFGYSVFVNSAVSKPGLGSTTAPQLNIQFSATPVVFGPGAGLSPLFLYVSDTDFLTGGKYLLTLVSNDEFATGSSTVTGRAWGGTSNTEFQISSANLFGVVGPETGITYFDTDSGAFNPIANPFSLTLGVRIDPLSAGTTDGRLNLQIAAVPEPATWAMVLLGFSGVGFMAYRRSRKDQGVALAA